MIKAVIRETQSAAKSCLSRYPRWNIAVLAFKNSVIPKTRRIERVGPAAFVKTPKPNQGLII